MNWATIIGLLLLHLLCGCTALVGAEPTDLSRITLGVDRKEVEAAAGSPTEIRSEEIGEVAVYDINLGMKAPFGDPCTYGACLYPWFWPLIEYDARIKFESQRRQVEVIFDRSQTVQFVRFVPGSLEPSEWLIEKMQLERDAEAGDANAQFGLYLFNAPDIDQWRWLCAAANNEQPLAQIELARHYWNGIKPFEENRIRGQMWYSLAETVGYAVSDSKGPSREGSLTPTEISEAERLVAEWEPNPAECEALAAEQ